MRRRLQAGSELGLGLFKQRDTVQSVTKPKFEAVVGTKNGTVSKVKTQVGGTRG